MTPETFDRKRKHNNVHPDLVQRLACERVRYTSKRQQRIARIGLSPELVTNLERELLRDL